MADVTTLPITRQVYDAFQRAELDRWDAVIADGVLIDSPAGVGMQGRDALKAWARPFLKLAKRIDLIDDHIALDDAGNGRGFITFNLHWKHTDKFFDLAPTGREGTSVETMLLTIRDGRVVRIDVADHTLDLVLYLWDRNWPHPHNISPEPIVAGVDRSE
jgi:hypothetical protein